MTYETVEQLDTRPPEVREYMDRLRDEIRAAFVVPEWAMRRPDAYNDWFRRQYDATEIIRRELVRIYSMFPPAILVPLGDAETAKKDGR